MSGNADAVLDAINGALRDYETSDDAMRWRPEEKRAPEAEPGAGYTRSPGTATDWAEVEWGPVAFSGGFRPGLAALPGGPGTVVIDVGAHARALNDFAGAVARAMLPVCEDMLRQFRALCVVLGPLAGEHRARGAAMRREYRRRSRARGRQRR